MLDAIKKLMAGRDAVADAFRAVDSIREAVAEKRAEVAKIEAARVPVAEAMIAVEGWLDRTATDAVDRLGLSHLLEPGRAASGLRLPVLLTRMEGGLAPDTSAGLDVLFGLMLAVNRDQVLNLLKGQLTDLADDRDVIPATERAARIEAARADLLQAELTEEAALRTLEKLGVEVQRRADADARAVLCADHCLPA